MTRYPSLPHDDLSRESRGPAGLVERVNAPLFQGWGPKF